MASTVASKNIGSATRAAESRPSRSPRFDADRRGALRSLVESFLSLFVAVLLFRTFAAEGYMISTGSMAPCLLGFHKRVECPTCGETFPFGVAYDTDDETKSEELVRGRSRAICPNCGQRAIDLSEVPRNHGDQLLVNKQAFCIARHSAGRSSSFAIRPSRRRRTSSGSSGCRARSCSSATVMFSLTASGRGRTGTASGRCASSSTITTINRIVIPVFNLTGNRWTKRRSM